MLETGQHCSSWKQENCVCGLVCVGACVTTIDTALHEKVSNGA